MNNSDTSVTARLMVLLTLRASVLVTTICIVLSWTTSQILLADEKVLKIVVLGMRSAGSPWPVVAKALGRTGRGMPPSKRHFTPRQIIDS